MAMRSKRGQVFLVGLMLGIVGFMAAMIFINPLTDVINEARGGDQLDCSNSSISDSQKGTCLIVDITLPAFIGVVVGLSGTYVMSKIV